MKDPRENLRYKLINRIVKMTPFVINCEADGKCNRDHPAVWFATLNCGCVVPVCDDGRKLAEQEFKDGLAVGESLNCRIHGHNGLRVQYFQPTPEYR